MADRDPRDLVIEMLANSDAALREEVVVYRMLGQAAIHLAHDVAAERDQLRERHQRLLDQFRALREQLVRQAEAV